MNWGDLLAHPMVVPSLAVLALAVANAISRVIGALTARIKSWGDARRLEVEMRVTAWEHQIEETKRLARENEALLKDNKHLTAKAAALLTDNGNLREMRERKNLELHRCTEYAHGVELEIGRLREDAKRYAQAQAQVETQTALLMRLTSLLMDAGALHIDMTNKINEKGDDEGEANGAV